MRILRPARDDEIINWYFLIKELHWILERKEVLMSQEGKNNEESLPRPTVEEVLNAIDWTAPSSEPSVDVNQLLLEFVSLLEEGES
ncbi:MAG: hypothetical protein WC531_01340 [Candidatus Paceibacterota bacterium]|jgi:hypothetical protein